MNLRLIPVFALVFVASLVAIQAADLNRCGGVLEGENGNFRFPPDSNEPSASTAPCLWIIRLISGTGIRFTLKQLSDQPYLTLYPEQLGASGTVLNPVILHASDVGTTIELPGKVLIATLPSGQSSISFVWESIAGTKDYQVLSAVDYIDTPEGQVQWQPSSSEESLTWAISSDVASSVSWRAVIGSGVCNDAVYPCQCFYFGVYELTLQGRLRQVVRTCGRSSSDDFENLFSQHIVFAYANITNQQPNVLAQISWSASDDAVPPTDTYVLSGTGEDHVQVYSLASTSVVREIGSEGYTYSVTYNMKNGHVYWSNYEGYVFRADFSGRNVVKIHEVPNGSQYSLALAYNWVGDNVYITEFDGQDELVICTAHGSSCATVAVAGIGACTGLALDPTEGQMYYVNARTNVIYKANMDGSDAIEILTGLTDPVEVVIDFEDSRLYWSEKEGRALKSSDLNGKDVRTVVEFNYTPWGIAVHKDRLYFSTHAAHSVISCSKRDGSLMKELYSVESNTFGITVADISSQPKARSNPCAAGTCSHICALSSSMTFRCLCPQNMKLSEDQRTCKYESSSMPENPDLLLSKEKYE